MAQLENIVIENARLIFRNFSGKEGKFNRAGDRNFCVLLDHDDAEKMSAVGWNIKTLNPRDPEDEPQPYIQVKVKFGFKPPKIYMVTSRGKTPLDEDMVELLDWSDIQEADLIIRPYEWEVSGKTGVAAYLQSLFATIVEDELDLKYSDVPDSALSAVAGDPWANETEEPPAF